MKSPEIVIAETKNSIWQIKIRKYVSNIRLTDDTTKPWKDYYRCPHTLLSIKQLEEFDKIKASGKSKRIYSEITDVIKRNPENFVMSKWYSNCKADVQP